MCRPFDASSARFNANGSDLDTTFGSNGSDIFDFGNTNEFANDLAFDASGRIVLAGLSGNAGLIVRLTAGGSLDTSFDSDGSLIVQPSGKSQVELNAIAVDSAGRIIAAGSAWTGSNYEMLSVRTLPSGTLDVSFDSDGIVATGTASHDAASSLLLQPDGKIVIGGVHNHATALWRLSQSGSLDTTFGTGGSIYTSLDGQFQGDQWTSVQSDGKHLYVTGWDDPNDTAIADVAVMRFNTGVSFDQTLYFEQDDNYNVTNVTNSGGEVLERYGYTPYGERTVYKASHVVVPETLYQQLRGHQGGEKDEETGAMLFQRRYLLTNLGTWGSRDPAVYLDSLNFTLVCRANPIRFVDPTGLAALQGKLLSKKRVYAQWTLSRITAGDTVLAETGAGLAVLQIRNVRAWFTRKYKDLYAFCTAANRLKFVYGDDGMALGFKDSVAGEQNGQVETKGFSGALAIAGLYNVGITLPWSVPAPNFGQNPGTWKGYNTPAPPTFDRDIDPSSLNDPATGIAVPIVQNLACGCWIKGQKGFPPVPAGYQ